ncbi:hypothetical protein ACJX0J_013032, partial [Zea mays]
GTTVLDRTIGMPVQERWNLITEILEYWLTIIFRYISNIILLFERTCNVGYIHSILRLVRERTELLTCPSETMDGI